MIAAASSSSSSSSSSPGLRFRIIRCPWPYTCRRRRVVPARAIGRTLRGAAPCMHTLVVVAVQLAAADRPFASSAARIFATRARACLGLGLGILLFLNGLADAVVHVWLFRVWLQVIRIFIDGSVVDGFSIAGIADCSLNCSANLHPAVRLLNGRFGLRCCSALCFAVRFLHV